MINAGTVAAYLTLDTTDFQKGLQTAGEQLASFQREHSDDNRGGALGALGKTLLDTVTAPFSAAGEALNRWVAQFHGGCGEMKNDAQDMGESVRNAQNDILAMGGVIASLGAAQGPAANAMYDMAAAGREVCEAAGEAAGGMGAFHASLSSEWDLSETAAKLRDVQGEITAIVSGASAQRRELTQEETAILAQYGQQLGDLLDENARNWLAMTAEQEICGAQMTDSTRQMVDGMCAAMEWLPEQTRGEMQRAWLGMKAELEAAYPALYAAAESDANSIINAVDAALGLPSGTSALQMRGQWAIGGLMRGMESLRGEAAGTAKSIVNGMLTAAGAVNFSPVGSSIVGGILSGLNARKGSLLAAAENIAAGISGRIRAALKINSPSRVMMEIGEFTAAGMELGLMKGSQSLYDTASAISRDTAEALSGISAARTEVPVSSGSADRMERLLDAVERLADTQTTVEIDGRPFGRLVREYV